MPTTKQMLSHADYSEPVIEAIAELRGAFLLEGDESESVVELLAAQISDPESIQSIVEELSVAEPHCSQALELLLQHGGQMSAAQFTREFGGVRRMGAAKQLREQPWLAPESTCERLFYLGLIGLGFSAAETSKQPQSIVYIPSDVIPWLPQPSRAESIEGFAVQAVDSPPESERRVADDAFLEDAGTLLGYLHNHTIRLADGAPHPDDLDRFTERLLEPYNSDSAPTIYSDAQSVDKDTERPEIRIRERQIRTNLLLHIAKRLGWLKLGEDDSITLTKNRVRAFLDAPRAEQRRMLWNGWRNSPDWNDLCQTPELECVNRSKWQNDPLQTRTTILNLIAKLEPGVWYKESSFLYAVKGIEPDFQRPTGEYDSWYIHKTSTQEFLSGFARWNEVEGQLLRFLIHGPLHWLHSVDLAEVEGERLFSLSQLGSFMLFDDASQPAEQSRLPIMVGTDFTITVPLGTPLRDRFNVERFADFESSQPDYTYQIRQRSLNRANSEGITPQRVLKFLADQGSIVPPHVSEKLEQFQPG